MKHYCASHVGTVRKNNEDCCMGEIIETEYGEIGIFAIADGMGGYNKGEVASRIAAKNMVMFLKENLLQNGSIKIDYINDMLKQAYNKVNYMVYEKSHNNDEYRGMGTTLTTAVVYENTVYLANVGDSRGYIYNEIMGLKRVTRDHSYVEELIERHAITEEEARNHPKRSLITRAIGTDSFVIVDIFKKKIEKNDIILLATDGLTGFVSDHRIENIMDENNKLEKMSDDLINTANSTGKDNVSVILVRA